jgi:hypothetical protein
MLSACGGSAAVVASSPASPSPSNSADSWEARSKLQEELLRSLVSSAQSWSQEPREDVRPSSGVLATLVLAKILALPDEATRVRFDCCQIYIGRSATREARKDGVDPGDMNAPVYVRNRFEHIEELPVARECPVVWNTNQVQNGLTDAYAKGCLFWLIIGDDGKVHGALWQPTY